MQAFTAILMMFVVGAPPERRFRDVHEVPWGDLSYDLGDGAYRFSRREYRETDDSGQCLVCMRILEVTFGDVDGDGQEDALLVIATNLGGAGTMLTGYVLGLVDGLPVRRATIEGGDRGEGGIASLRVRGGDVIVRRFSVGPSDSMCCPRLVALERWHWVGGTLIKRRGATTMVKRKRRPWQLEP